MKKRLLIMTLAACAAVAVQAADVSTYVDFASAYVFRGATFNNGLVMQPGAEISGFPIDEACGSLAIGIWGNYDLDDNDGEGSDFSEIDYYLSYTLPIEALDLSMAYTEYVYPESGLTNDKELNLTIGSALGTNGLYASVAVNYGVGGYLDDSWYIQPALEYETELSDALTASAGISIGYVISGGDIKADGVADGFNDATASVGLGYALNDNWSVSGGLTHIAQLDDDVLSDDAYDVDLVATVGIACDF